MIEIKDVMKSFENKNVLNHLNVTISSGSIFGLIGPNGAGKSTLLYLLNGISKCDEGSILFDGKDVYENPDVKKDILFISDDPYYFHFATIDEMKDFYLTFYPQFNLETYQHYVDLFRLPQNKPLKYYSKGMKRQAMFALALAIAPKYLLLDEPEVSLSPANQVALAQEINELTHYLGCQFIIATHSPFMLGTLNAKIYNLDAREYEVTPWYKLENVRYFYDFFKKHEKEFNDWVLFFFTLLTNH